MSVKVVAGVTTIYAIFLLCMMWPKLHQITSSRDLPAEGDLQNNDLISEMVRHAWGGYHSAFTRGGDELRPLSNTTVKTYGGVSVSAFESMTTLFALGLMEEFEQAAGIVLETCDVLFASHRVKETGDEYDRVQLSVLQTTRRHIGSLLSIYAQLEDPRFLACAEFFGDNLLLAFQNRHHVGLPTHSAFLGRTGVDDGPSGDKLVLSEMGALQVELRYLSYFTKKSKYAESAAVLVQRLLQIRATGWPNNSSHYETDVGGDVDQDLSNGTPHYIASPHIGLWPALYDPRSGRMKGPVGFGVSAGFYECLLKQWIAFKGLDKHRSPQPSSSGFGESTEVADMYEDAVEGMLNHLLQYTQRTHYAFLGEYGFEGIDPTQTHAACSVPGLLTLGVIHGVHRRHPKDETRSRKWGDVEVITAAIDLAATCYRLYSDSPSGLAPNSVRFSGGVKDKKEDSSYFTVTDGYLLGSETVESLFYLYQYTGDAKYKSWMLAIQQRLDVGCRTPVAYAALSQVGVVPNGGAATQRDEMKSDFLSKTLKYLWLGLQAPSDALSLDRYVLSAQAHPLPILW